MNVGGGSPITAPRSNGANAPVRSWRVLRRSARPLSTPPSTPFCNSYPTRPSQLRVLWMRGSRAAYP